MEAREVHRVKPLLRTRWRIYPLGDCLLHLLLDLLEDFLTQVVCCCLATDIARLFLTQVLSQALLIEEEEVL